MRTTLTIAFLSPFFALLTGCPGHGDSPANDYITATTLPSAPPPPPSSTQVELVAELHAPPVEDVAPDAQKLGGRPADVAGLQACCRALQQNAASMPPPNNMYAATAATVCRSLIAATASGAETKGAALAQVQAALRGAGMPPACR